MIRLEVLSIRNNRAIAEEWVPGAGSLWPEAEGSLVRLVRHNERPSALFWACEDGDETRLNVCFAPGTDDRRKLLAVITERVVRRFHPARIVIENPDPALYAVYESNSYRPIRNTYAKAVEPWRKILNDAVFDDEGFIINQGRMKDIPFGWFKTDAKGCGWISAWNLLKMNGMETTMEVCAHGLEKHAFMGEMMGQSLIRLYFWLKKQGLDVSMSLPLNGAAKSMIEKTRTGIILYNHARGAHYIAYRRLSDTKIQIYNAVYGKRNHVMTTAEFLKKYPLFPTTVVIGVK